MSGPDGIDERFGTLVGELRSGEVTASPELRERVRAIATREPEPPGARLKARLPRRRVALVLVPVCALAAAAVGVGVFTSGGNKRATEANSYSIQHGNKKVGSGQGTLFVPRAHSIPIPPRPAPNARPQAGLNAYQSALAPSGQRHQLYSADLRLRVSDLSGTTKEAIRLTRGWGGYVVTVDYGSGQKSGEAYLVVRVPIARVQTALARLTALGTIVADHVSIRDIQGQLNRRFSRMADLRAQIANLRAKLTDTSLTQSERAFFEAALAQRRASLAKLQDEQTAQKTRADFATVSLDLETKKAAAVVPSKPSRIGQALHNIGRVLVTEAEILLYVLLIGAPFVLLGVLLWLTFRLLRRRSDEQLLAR
jgi:uncharacterized protein DUF4349